MSSVMSCELIRIMIKTAAFPNVYVLAAITTVTAIFEKAVERVTGHSCAAAKHLQFF